MPQLASGVRNRQRSIKATAKPALLRLTSPPGSRGVHAAAGNEKKRSMNMVEHDATTSQPVLTTTQLANQRTDLALLRTSMAADRTLMAWVRTALSMISFGFTIYKFLQDVNRYVRENGGMGIREQGPQNLGLSLIALGTGGLLVASIQHWRLLKELNAEKPRKYVWSLSLTIACFISIIGLMAFLSVLLRRGPF
jgi:putative membrane protein